MLFFNILKHLFWEPLPQFRCTLCNDNKEILILRWKTIYFSLAGRVNAIKMNILPRFLYLFQCLPLFLPKLFFTTLDKLITGFLWGNKLPRINKVMLQRHRTQGGLSLPNFRFYYWAANIQKIMYWIKFPQINWCLIEAYSCPSCSLVF